MLDLYNAENRTQLDELNEAEHGEWLRKTFNAETQTVTQADKAIAVQDFMKTNSYTTMLEKGQGELALELFNASDLISANGWSIKQMPDDSFVIVDESGDIVDDSSFTSISSGIVDDPDTKEREDLLTTKGEETYINLGTSGSYNYAVKQGGVVDTSFDFGGEDVSYKIDGSTISYKVGGEGEWKTISSEGTDTSIYNVGLDIAGKMNPEVEYGEANEIPGEKVDTTSVVPGETPEGSIFMLDEKGDKVLDENGEPVYNPDYKFDPEYTLKDVEFDIKTPFGNKGE
jgi:hypothetical protein